MLLLTEFKSYLFKNNAFSSKITFGFSFHTIILPWYLKWDIEKEKKDKIKIADLVFIKFI